MDEEVKIEGKIDIGQALKEFEMKSKNEEEQKAQKISQVPEMPQNNEVSGVKFETDSWKAVKYYKETSTPKMIELVIKWSGGSIKSQKQAEYILLGFVVIAMGIAIYLFLGGANPQTKLTPAEIEQLKNMTYLNQPLPQLK